MSAITPSKTPVRSVQICGGIASGKTTLARSLSKAFLLRPIEEEVKSIPFWQEFYESGGKQHPLQKNVGFMLFHAYDLFKASNSEQPSVFDFAYFQDLAYVDLSHAIGSKEVEILEDIHGRMTSSIIPPTVVVDLNCAIEVQLERILERAERFPERKSERNITPEFLQNLRKAIDARRQIEESRGVVFVSLDSGNCDFRVPNENVSAIGSDIEEAVTLHRLR